MINIEYLEKASLENATYSYLEKDAAFKIPKLRLPTTKSIKRGLGHTLAAATIAATPLAAQHATGIPFRAYIAAGSTTHGKHYINSNTISPKEALNKGIKIDAIEKIRNATQEAEKNISIASNQRDKDFYTRMKDRLSRAEQKFFNNNRILTVPNQNGSQQAVTVDTKNMGFDDQNAAFYHSGYIRFGKDATLEGIYNHEKGHAYDYYKPGFSAIRDLTDVQNNIDKSIKNNVTSKIRGIENTIKYKTGISDIERNLYYKMQELADKHKINPENLPNDIDIPLLPTTAAGAVTVSELLRRRRLAKTKSKEQASKINRQHNIFGVGATTASLASIAPTLGIEGAASYYGSTFAEGINKVLPWVGFSSYASPAIETAATNLVGRHLAKKQIANLPNKSND